MANTGKNRLQERNPKKKDAAELYRRGLALFEGDGVEKDEQEGAYLISEAAKLGCEEAQDWIDDYTFDDDALVQGES
ncbi:MAG: SEL1-like repeat protein [Bacilli bacterium]|nr:SEL1-like repeat protein [Bacilli bacterium]